MWFMEEVGELPLAAGITHPRRRVRRCAGWLARSPMWPESIWLKH